jgi:hypothetical protein
VSLSTVNQANAQQSDGNEQHNNNDVLDLTTREVVQETSVDSGVGGNVSSDVSFLKTGEISTL